ncbi:MAG: recombinase family protein [Reyranella sp.]|uniref:recombinase family protein n=1 Tax=Reyranella sp. TaxID=1929291 RepID=UPI0025E3710E|nr:recombinase family protein [Reyranella sp.]MBR2818212.1 recombinase family protein [Reyranella sp.]
MARKKTKAVAYYRTSSATHLEDRDSKRRQTAAVEAYAKRNKIEIVEQFYDEAVSGADPVPERDGFRDLMAFCAANGIHTVLVENASRFARDLVVQLTGHALLKQKGINLIPVDAPEHFTDPSPTAVMVQQILGSVSQFEKNSLVAKLKAARDRKRAETGRCEGRPAVPQEVVAEARRLARRSPKTGKRRSLRQIAELLEQSGHLGPSGRYHAGSIQRMLGR